MIHQLWKWTSARLRWPKRAAHVPLPRIVTLKNFIPEGCQFEISTPIEVFRVEQFGGEERFTRQVLNELRQGDVLFDVGACVGMIAVHAAKKGTTTVAFEPDPSYRSRLERNIDLNGLKGILIVEWAVSDHSGEATLFTDGVEGYSPSLREMGKRGRITVRTETIDHALRTGELPTPTVVKMDIEGAEILALRGMAELLASDNSPRAIFMEIHSDYLASYGSSVDEIRTFLETAGYVEAQVEERLSQLHCIYRK